NVSRQSVIDVLEKLITTPAPTTAREHEQCRTPEILRVFQKKKREDRNQDEPGSVKNDISQRCGCEFSCSRTDFLQNLGNRVVGCVNKPRRNPPRLGIFDYLLCLV